LKKVVDALVEHFGPRSEEGRGPFENTSTKNELIILVDRASRINIGSRCAP